METRQYAQIESFLTLALIDIRELEHKRPNAKSTLIKKMIQQTLLIIPENVELGSDKQSQRAKVLLAKGIV